MSGWDENSGARERLYLASYLLRNATSKTHGGAAYARLVVEPSHWEYSASKDCWYNNSTGENVEVREEAGLSLQHLESRGFTKDLALLLIGLNKLEHGKNLYKIAVEWVMANDVEICADSFEEACKKLELLDVPMKDAIVVDDSLRVNHTVTRLLNGGKL